MPFRGPEMEKEFKTMKESPVSENVKEFMRKNGIHENNEENP